MVSEQLTPHAQVNVAIVGLGFMGVTHLRAHLDNPKAGVVAVCDAVRLPVNGVLAGVAGNIKKTDDIHLGLEVRAYRALEELLRDPEVALVDLCTPTALHVEQSIACLRAGKHVVCEKPLARTSPDARRIVEAAEQSKRLLMPAMCVRFWPGWAWLKQVVSERTYGNVLAARFRRVSEKPSWSQKGTYASDAGGALFDLHIHDSDFVNHLFGRPAQVFSTGVVGKDGSIDHVVTQYRYAHGPIVHAEGSWLHVGGFNMGYTLHCEGATLDFDLTRGDQALLVTEPGQPARAIPLEEGDGYSAELRYIVDCVAENRVPTVVTARDGVTALEICEAEEKSIRTGLPVDL